MDARAEGAQGTGTTPRGGVLRAAARAGGRAIRLGLAAALLGLAACASPPASRPAEKVCAHEDLNAILWMQTSAEYRAATLQAFHAATAQLDAALADRTWTAALEQTGDFGALPPAVVLDMDEAIVRSDRFQAGLVAHDQRFRISDWNDWVRTETSEAIPGALEYAREVRAHGVHIFYVTNRTAEVEAASLATLLELGFPVEGGADDLLTQGERPGWDANKSSRRAFISRTHRILQIVGDNLNDFVSGAHTTVAGRRALTQRYASYWGVRWIVMPNPSYGGWERALLGYERGLSRAEQIERKRRYLRPWR